MVFNGALKTSSGFLAKSSIVEGKNFVLSVLFLRELKKKAAVLCKIFISQ